MTRSVYFRMAIAVSAVWFTVTGTAGAETYEANPSNYKEFLGKLKPGDTLKLAAGTYPDGLSWRNAHGEQGKPIVITGPESGDPAVFVAKPKRNTISVSGGGSWFTIRNLTLDGKKLSGPFGVTLKGGPFHDVVLDSLRILDHGGQQQTDGIAMNDRVFYWNITIRNCTIVNAGTGIYLGNPGGKGAFIGGLIENNVVVDPIGYCMQIKYQRGERPAHVPEKDTIIRNNIFVKTKSGTGGGSDGARPNVNLNPTIASGRGSKDKFIVYGNLFYQNYMSDSLLQACGNLEIHNNVFINEIGSRNALNVQRHHSGGTRLSRIFHNTIVAKGYGLTVRGTSGTDHAVFGNAVFAARPLRLDKGVQAFDNKTGSYEDAAKFLSVPYGAIGQRDVYPLAGTLAADKMDTTRAEGILGSDVDFNGVKRTRSFYGAYAGEGKNPAGPLSLDGKAPVKNP